MEFDVTDMKMFWNRRYQEEGRVWGDLPSRTAKYALELFRKSSVDRILVPGSGYGRNSKLFSESGFDVSGVDISRVAHELAIKYDPLTKHYCQSVLDMSLNDNEYDAIYCFNTLHLFHAKERALFLKECANKLRDDGLLFFTVFSEKEPSFGRGMKIDEYTFESRPGRPTHYFTEHDLRDHFKDFKILEMGITEELEVHGEGPHTHILWYILARK